MNSRSVAKKEEEAWTTAFQQVPTTDALEFNTSPMMLSTQSTDALSG
jgi:hypothetical protein